jgi:LysM repeat protein
VIETIYSNENGEGSPGNKTQASFKLPKNVRQIGKSNVNKKIYVEDYVMTYIKQLIGGDYSACRAAVLVGQCIRLDNCRNIFISGAVEVSEFDMAEEINFSNDTWTKIYEEIKKYFVETEIVGWFIGGPGYLLEDTDKIMKAHINNFAGQDKVLFTFDNLEKEEAFYCYENNRLARMEGYYIYYEKNEEMQSYMVEHKEPQSMEANYEDRVAKEIRTVLQNKKQPIEEGKGISRLMYAAGTLLAIIVLVVGAAILNNYDQMKSMQDTLKYLSQNMEEVQSIATNDRLTDTIDSGTAVVEGQGSDISKEEAAAGKQEQTDTPVTTPEDSLDVEVVPGKVEPIEEAGNQETAVKEGTKPAKTDEEGGASGKTASAESLDKTKPAETKKENKINYYIVVEGDTLADVSYKLYKTYTKVNKIMELNGIDNQDLIYVGQKLIVP